MTTLLTIQDVRRILKCSRTYVYHLIGRGDLRVVKLGRLTRIIEADIERFLANTVAGGDSDATPESRTPAAPATVDIVGRQLRTPRRRRHSATMPADQPWLLEPDRREAME